MQCPFCAEEIKDEAIVCRYCTRTLPLTGERKKDRRARIFVWCFGIAVVAIAGVFIAAYYSEQDDIAHCHSLMIRGAGLTDDQCMELVHKNGPDVVFGLMDPKR